MFDQSPYNIRVEWGRRGAREAAARGDILIIVDVLSFSSTVTSALHHGAVIYPYPPHLDGKRYAETLGAEYILGRAEAAKSGKPTLSPVSFNEGFRGGSYVLTSLNGAFCTWAGSKVPALLIGSLLNSSATASAANLTRERLGADITVIPCGEQWNGVMENEDTLRPSIEDYLGAGAIIAGLEGTLSPEAEVCHGAWLASKDRMADLLWECGSGRELRERGFGPDVSHCARLDAFDTVPFLQKDRFVTFN